MPKKDKDGRDAVPSIADFIKPQMLRHAVGRAIFCPGCRKVMDCSRSVEVDVTKDGKLVTSKVVCAPCYDADIKTLVETLAAKHACEIDVTDGRTIDWRRVPRG